VPRRYVTIGLSLVLCLLFIFLVMLRARVNPLNAQANAGAQLACMYTGETWNGKPVYMLQNSSSTTLHFITVESWRGDNLTVLSIGHAPALRDALAALHSPPYSLPSHAQLWFVGATTPPTRITVIWLVDGQATYANLKVKVAQP